MLAEFMRVRQESTGYRRLFTDDLFDLYVWYEDRSLKRLTGFQLVYQSGFEQKALTWTERNGYLHTKIDEGDKKMNQSPILVLDGLFEYHRVHDELKRRLRDVEESVSLFVLAKIESYERSSEPLIGNPEKRQ